MKNKIRILASVMIFALMAVINFTVIVNPSSNDSNLTFALTNAIAAGEDGGVAACTESGTYYESSDKKYACIYNTCMNDDFEVCGSSNECCSGNSATGSCTTYSCKSTSYKQEAVSKGKKDEF